MGMRPVVFPIAVLLALGADVGAAPAATLARFSAPVTVPVDSPIELVAGDFDGDGVPDLRPRASTPT